MPYYRTISCSLASQIIGTHTGGVAVGQYPSDLPWSVEWKIADSEICLELYGHEFVRIVRRTLMPIRRIDGIRDMGRVVGIWIGNPVPAARPTDLSSIQSRSRSDYTHMTSSEISPPEQGVSGKPAVVLSLPPPLKHCHQRALWDLERRQLSFPPVNDCLRTAHMSLGSTSLLKGFPATTL